MRYPHRFASYHRPFIDYPGQEADCAAKRENQRLLASRLHGTVVRPGETFSLWHRGGRPTRRKGYRQAAALVGGALTTETGGAICLLSTALYNTALLGGMEVVERRCHSVDSYGEGRYFELGRDATIEYGYIDLRFRNPHSFSVVLSVTVDDGGVSTALRSTAGPDFRATIEVSPPRRFIAPDGARGLAVQTSRTLHPSAGDARTERLGESRYLEAAS